MNIRQVLIGGVLALIGAYLTGYLSAYLTLPTVSLPAIGVSWGIIGIIVLLVGIFFAYKGIKSV